MSTSRFVVGIDLGTTNSVVAYADTSLESPSVALLPIPQLTRPGTVESLPALPSFVYLPAPSEFAADATKLPWKNTSTHIAGSFARQRGTEVPTRLIGSAKSWLSHSAVDRNAALLPWDAPEDVAKISPVAASTEYLRHLRAAWDSAFRDAPLAKQEVVLTVPASFDAVARELTVHAAVDAGLPQVTLIEEPQAAFYAWIDSSGDAWRQAVRAGDVVLVCDIGGGTTDFTLIAVRDDKGQLGLERIAVGDHILLGGDNMDLALAYRVREQLAKAGTNLDAWQFRALTMSCRDAKEQLLGSDAKSFAVSLLGRGRKLIGGTVRTDVARSEVDTALVDGFFPLCARDAVPQQQRRTALLEMGLPYASDPAVTHHLAAFLSRHAGDLKSAGSEHPTAMLFNGGVMRAATLRQRLVNALGNWSGNDAAVRVLEGADPDHAVARGAAYFGLVRRGKGVRIRGGTARSYYVGIETAMPAVPGMRPPMKALCVAPRGIEEGTEVPLPPQEFGLVVGQPTEFRFLSSATRRDDQVGALIEDWGDDISELEPLALSLEAKGQDGSTVPVRLQARLTDVGTLELWCVSRDSKQRWKLEFNVRGQ